jgi:uncharacterized OB-fold protein
MDTPARTAKGGPKLQFELVTDQWTRPFWDAAARHQLMAPCCGDCGRFRMPPTPFCPACRSQHLTWVQSSGAGILYSYSVVRRALSPDMEDSIPYVIAVVELPDVGGIRLITNIVETPLERLYIGTEVTVVFDELPGGVSVPLFKLKEALNDAT